jgi:hypothetical protein
MKSSFISSGFISLLLFIITENNLSAQLTRFGGGLCFSTGIDQPPVETGNPGLNLRAVYEINDKMFILPALTFYAPKRVSYPIFDLQTYYGHVDAWFGYSIAHQKQIMFYAIAGPNLTGLYKSFKTDDPNYKSGSDISPGVSIGTGVEMIINMNFNAYAQVHYIIGKYQQLIISIGTHYYFEGRRYKSWR